MVIWWCFEPQFNVKYIAPAFFWGKVKNMYFCPKGKRWRRGDLAITDPAKHGAMLLDWTELICTRLHTTALHCMALTNLLLTKTVPGKSGSKKLWIYQKGLQININHSIFGSWRHILFVLSKASFYRAGMMLLQKKWRKSSEGKSVKVL